MEKSLKNKLNLSEQLLQARQEQLDNQLVGALRSHGKLWGMDVFTWYKPSLYELENTLSSFPAPIFWFANEEDILKLLKEETNWMSNLNLICSHDKAGFKLPNEVLDGVKTVIGTAKIEDAFELLKVFKKPQGILLFTSSGQDWHVAKEKFETFLSIHQQ